MKRKVFILAFMATVLFSLLACQAVTGVPGGDPVVVFPTAAPTTPAGDPGNNSSPSIIPNLVSLQDTLTALYEKVNEGVVMIRVLTEQGEALGSGFVFDTEGHILTNYHVVEGVTELEIDFPSGLKVRGKVLGTDLDSDLAIIKVNVPKDQLHPLPLGDSDQLKVGQTVVAIGNPFGLSGTMTVGVISAVGRTLSSMHEAPGGNFFTAGDIVQTDAAINPGNSGGPLLNLNGEVVGISRAIRTENYSTGGEPVNSGIGFAVAINIIKHVVPSIIANGKYQYPYLGITSLDEITLLIQEALSLPRATGAYVSEITPGSPADKAGLVAGSKSTNIPGLKGGGDLIIAIDGNEIATFGDMLSYIVNHKGPGDMVVLTVLRDNKEMEVKLTLGIRP